MTANTRQRIWLDESRTEVDSSTPTKPHQTSEKPTTDNTSRQEACPGNPRAAVCAERPLPRRFERLVELVGLKEGLDAKSI